MSFSPPFTLRIKTEQDQDIDWMVQPDEITFRQALEVISRIYPDTTTTAFQYVDDDGERITVRSDEELKAMIQMYFSELSEEDISRGLLPPLVIYPRVGKTPKDRNIHDLKIKTTKASQVQEKSEMSRMEPLSDRTATNSPPDNMKVMLGKEQTSEEDFKYICVLGNGIGGCVYKALHEPSKMLMAVKVIKMDIDVAAQRKILSEMDILHKCHSPSIIGFYGAFFVENRISICTEFMDGGSLDKYGKIPEDVLGRIAVRIVQGLIYMWSLKILHRDVKPSNILVNSQGQVKLCDFGVSTQLVESIAMTFVGTNAYMAPERIKAENYGVPSEVWSLGVTLFELAAGEFPYKNVVGAPSPIQFLTMILEYEAPILPVSDFSPELVNLVSCCMQKQPEQRIPHPQLLAHPFIQKYVSEEQSLDFLAKWVRSQIPMIHFTAS